MLKYFITPLAESQAFDTKPRGSVVIRVVVGTQQKHTQIHARTRIDRTHTNKHAQKESAPVLRDRRNCASYGSNNVYVLLKHTAAAAWTSSKQSERQGGGVKCERITRAKQQWWWWLLLLLWLRRELVKRTRSHAENSNHHREQSKEEATHPGSVATVVKQP